MSYHYTEGVAVGCFRRWFQENGGYIHPAAMFITDATGISVEAAENVPANAKVVSCPFSLAITPSQCKLALMALLGNDATQELEKWSEYQLIASYIVFHDIIDQESVSDSIAMTTFKHLPYINILPKPDSLRTPHFLTPQEKELLQNTDVGKSAGQRELEQYQSWKNCNLAVSNFKPQWKAKFSAEIFFAACAYISSRAFPSTVLSPAPTLQATSNSYPVLIPGLDSLNHARGQAVTWLVDFNHSSHTYDISLVLHSSTLKDSELLNNYGPKSNAELLLGYGFVISDNPEDIVSFEMRQPDNLFTKRVEIGRSNRGIEPLWEQMVAFTMMSMDSDGPEDDNDIPEWQLNIEAGKTLSHFLDKSQSRIPQLPKMAPLGVRPDVFEMISIYIKGIRDIMADMFLFAHAKIEQGRRQAQDFGIQYDDDEDDET